MCVLNLVLSKHTLKEAKSKINLSLWKTLLVNGKLLESRGVCRAQKSMNGKMGNSFALGYIFITYFLQTKVDCLKFQFLKSWSWEIVNLCP